MKFKSKSLISIILSIMMVISMILVAIPANAAVIDSEPVGAGTYYLWYTIGANTDYSSFTKKVEMTADGTNYVASFEDSSLNANTTFICYINTDSSTITTGLNTLNSNTTGTFDSTNFHWLNVGNGYNQGDYYYIKSQVKSSFKVKVTFNPTANTIALSKDDGTTPIETTAQPATETTSPVPTTSWSIVGSGIFGDEWAANSGSAVPLDETYAGDSNVVCKTVTFTEDTWFRFSDGTNTYYGTSNDQALGDSSNKITLNLYSSGEFAFKNTDAQTIKICLDTLNKKVWYETATGPIEPTEGDFKIVDKTDANGKLTFSARDKAAGTANAGDEVTVTATPSSYFECKSISVSYKDNNKVAHDINATKTADNTFKFTVPDGLATTDVKSQEITVKGTFTLTSTGKLDYVKAQNDGLWIDVAPYQNDSTSTLIKWNNYYGKNHNTTTNPYTFYVPKNVNLSNAVIYNVTGSQITLGGQTIANQSKAENVNLVIGDNTITGGSVRKVKVMQGSTNAMFLTTSTALPTQYNPAVTGSSIAEEDAAAKAYKEKVNYKGGSCKTMTNTGSEASFSSAMGLSSIKGRGNSSWKASAMNFGKYAFNMKLSSATNLFDMDTTESTGSKSWCLLANNADESMLRNALTYQLAKDIGILYSPEFRFVDIYDNGEYMGSYLVTEKVDVGSSKLVKGESFDDINEKAAGTVDETTVTNEEYSYGTGTYAMSYAKVTSDGNTSSIASKTGGKYLLEFEITERYTDEASWFTSPRGQHVVVKSPEFATKEQVTYIAQKFAAMEDIAFTTGATKAQLSTVMDVESFAKMYLIQEFSSNLDAASTSYYLTFDCSKNDANGNGAVFVANPVWDYDWAYGQYENDTKKGKDSNSEYILNTKDAGSSDGTGNYWVAKYKYFDDSKGTNGTNYSIQSQLASQNSAFKTEIRKQWEGANGFYTTIQKYHGTNGQINTWYNQIKESVDMNETRWNFIDKDPISSWGSVNTGANHQEAVNSLNTWTSDRATWLNAQFTNASEYTPFTPATPASTVTDVNGTTKNTFEVGESFLINVTTVEDDVTYSVYLGDTPVGDNVENGKIKVVATADMIGDKTFTVKATYGDKVETSTVNVTVTASTDVRTIKIYFKTATAPAYAPSVSFDGGDATAMTKSSELGKDYSGALTFAWYSVSIENVDTTKTHALTFTSKRTKLNATWNGKLTSTASYFTADNLMSDTVAVDLTGKRDIELNFFYSATNMVYDSTDAKNKTLGFTFVGGERVKMGSVVNDSNGTVTAVSEPTVKSATYIQMLNASMITVSSLQSELYDVNFDGKVDVKDATYIQYALAS